MNPIPFRPRLLTAYLALAVATTVTACAPATAPETDASAPAAAATGAASPDAATSAHRRRRKCAKLGSFIGERRVVSGTAIV